MVVVLFCRDGVFDLFDANGREFILEDLAIGFDGRIGQDVCDRLDIGKRDEHHSLGNRPNRPRHDLDRAAACGQSDYFTRLDPLQL